MDILRWLVETVEQSDEDSHHKIDSHHLQKSNSRHHKRAASPIPAVPFEATSNRECDQQKVRRHKRKISDVRSATDAISSSSGSSTTSDSSSSSSAPSEHFERRQRHKTRKDLYEPRSGVRKKRTKQDDKAETRAKKRKKKKEKQHRCTEKKMRGVKRPGQDFHENFAAKNVRDDRLTLKPQPVLGLLKKGRASSPTKPRGLPDLVFSEMQFLKKPRPSIEQSGRAEAITKSDKKRGKKNNKVEEEEVSAYFGSTREPRPEQPKQSGARTATSTTSSSKPQSVTVSGKNRAHELQTRPTAIVEDPRRTGSQSPRHILRSRASNTSTLRATSSTVPLSNIAAEVRQLHQVQPSGNLIADTAIPGPTTLDAIMQAARPMTTIEDVDTEALPRHNNDALAHRRSETKSAHETSRAMEAQTASTRSRLGASIDPAAGPHDSPMAKLLQACQTSVQAPPARPRSRSTNHQPGMKDFKFAQPEYTAGHGISVAKYRADDDSDMKDFSYAQPRYARGDSVTLRRPDCMKAVQHARPKYSTHHVVSMAPHAPGIELMQEPHNGYVEDFAHERSYKSRPAHHQPYDADFHGAYHDFQRHHLDQKQQQQQRNYHHDRHQNEHAVTETRNRYMPIAPSQPSCRPAAREPYEEHYLPLNSRYEDTHSIDERFPQFHDTHVEQYHYPPQPLHGEIIYYDDPRVQDTEVYRQNDIGYMAQEQDLYMPQPQYETPQYDIRDAIDMDLEQQMAEEEMINEELEVREEETEESRGFVPDDFWRPRKRW